jgi:hypothetical protein
VVADLPRVSIRWKSRRARGPDACTVPQLTAKITVTTIRLFITTTDNLDAYRNLLRLPVDAARLDGPVSRRVTGSLKLLHILPA